MTISSCHTFCLENWRSAAQNSHMANLMSTSKKPTGSDIPRKVAKEIADVLFNKRVGANLSSIIERDSFSWGVAQLVRRGKCESVIQPSRLNYADFYGNSVAKHAIDFSPQD